MSKGTGIHIGLITICCFLATLPSACSPSGDRKPIDASLVHRVRQNMSEREVVELMGRPHRVSTACYEPDNPARARILDYKLDDGLTWVVVIDEHDQLIGSGEKDTGRSTRQSDAASTN